MIIVPKEAPENMEKALREAVEAAAEQLAEISKKYGLMVGVDTYADGDAHIAVTSKEEILCFYTKNPKTPAGEATLIERI